MKILSLLTMFCVLTIGSSLHANSLMVSPFGFIPENGEFSESLIQTEKMMLLNPELSTQPIQVSQTISLSYLNRKRFNKINVLTITDSKKRMRIRFYAIHIQKGFKKLIASRKVKKGMDGNRWLRLKTKYQHRINSKKYIYQIQVDFLDGAAENTSGDYLSYLGMKINAN